MKARAEKISTPNTVSFKTNLFAPKRTKVPQQHMKLLDLHSSRFRELLPVKPNTQVSKLRQKNNSICPKIIGNLTAGNSGETTPFRGIRDAKYYQNLDDLKKPSFNQMYHKSHVINVDTRTPKNRADQLRIAKIDTVTCSPTFVIESFSKDSKFEQSVDFS